VAHTSCFRMPQSAPPDPPQAALSAVALGKAGQSTRRAPNGGDTEKVHPAKAWASPCWAGSLTWRHSERKPHPKKRPVSASKCRSVVNRKAGENFEVRNICLRNHGEFESASLEGPAQARARGGYF